MAVAWNALMNMPNPGVAFTQGFENARTRKLQEEQLREERAFRMEGRQMERDKFQFERQKAALDAHRENIELGAEIIAAVQPKDQAGWDMALGMARQRGVNIEALGVPTTFDPEYASAIARLGGGEQKAPTSFEEFQRAQSDPQYARFLEERRGPIVANNGDGTFTIIPRSAFSGSQQGGPPPPPPPGFVLDSDGGPAASPPATFQPGVGPR